MCNVRVAVTDDHRMKSDVVELDRQGEGKRVMVADPIHGSDPMGNLKGEFFVMHHRQVVDTVGDECAFDGD